MNHRLLLGLLILTVTVSGCTSSGGDSSSQENYSELSNQVPQGPNTTVVNYTDSGFEPSTVEISKGETVAWIDSSSSPMWVGVNQHPTHTNYDGSSTSEHCENGEAKTDSVFDQCSVGDTYSFTFNKEGDWSYHNHRGPTDGGSVIVS
jgi:hypothetical protein